MMKRRTFLQGSMVASWWLLQGCQNDHSSSSNHDEEMMPGGETVGTVLTPPSNNSLFIPELLEPIALNGIQRFELSIEAREHTFFNDAITQTYGINGSYLGPTLKLRKGSRVVLEYTNFLSEPTTMHGHGLHLPAKMDGGPHQVIAPNETWEATFTVKQKACTSWYHPHTLHETARQVYLGLAGLIIVEDDESETLALPHQYGVDDIPLIIQNRRFNSEKQFDYSPTTQEILRGYTGGVTLVNGEFEPYFVATSKQLRLRLLNGSNAEVYRIGLTQNQQFKQIATDNSFLEAPQLTSSIQLSPGERAEIVVDLAQISGGEIALYNLNTATRLLNIKVGNNLVGEDSLPTRLTTLQRLRQSDAVRSRTFTLEGMMGRLTINNKQMDLARIDETLSLNEVEIWEVINQMGVDHNFHIHATHFQIIERNGSAEAVDDTEKGYKDTVFIPAHQRVKFLVKMVDYSDGTEAYMYHCHFLEHEDAGMMGQFVVI